MSNRGGGGGVRGGGRGKAAGANTTTAPKKRNVAALEASIRGRHPPPDVIKPIESASPRVLTVEEFVQARAKELQSLTKTVEGFTGTKRAFQTLPRHLRRRAMSHNVYRIPVRLRQAAKREMAASGEPPKGSTTTKRHRKHKRRPKFLLQDYERRQRTFRWLETHIWHAKRMHMDNLWGFRLSVTPTDKGARACYRADVHLCTIHDASYIGCLQLKGHQQDLLRLLSSMILHDNTKHKEEDTNSLSFLEDGTHRGSVMLYSPGRAPFGAICPAQYLWGPKEKKEEKEKEKEAGGKADERRIWMWVHPAAFARLCAVLQSVAPKHNVEVKSMKEELLLFELRGPLSHTCITSVLFQSIVSTDNNKDFPLTVEQLWLSLGRNDNRKKPKTASAAASSSSASSSSSSSKNGERVIALRVKDPRWTFPPPPPKKQAQLVQRLQNEKGLKENEDEDALPKSAFYSSALWNDVARAALSTDVPSDGEVAKQKRDSITVGLSLASKQEEVKEANDERPKKEDEMEMDTETTKTKVPREIDILLIERRTKQGVKHNIIGWDIILPSGWAMPFWKSFIYAGARAIALQERHAAATERGECSFPEDYPDTIAHAQHSERVEQQLREEHFKRPPAKRPNFKELEVASPFHPRWTSLLLSQDCCCLEGGEEKEAKEAGENEGLSTPSTLRVLKRKNEEEEEEEKEVIMEEDKEKGVNETAEEEAEVPFYVLRGEQALTLFKQHREDASSTSCSSSPSTSLPTSFPLCLVRVEVRMLHRGTPSWNSLLYLPLPEDEDALTLDPALWAKQEVQRQKEGTPRRRRLVGRVTSGGFSFSKGRGNAQAFCCAQLLLSSAFSASNSNNNNKKKKKTQMMVLVRKTTSAHYLPATIHPLP